MERLVDLRSDTVTRPTPGMREAMARAEVGDDVFGEDPTVVRLERAMAERLGHEAGLFVPTGTMGNQIAIALHVGRGEDVLLDASSHVYRYELGAMAAWSGAMPRLVPERAPGAGRPSPAALRDAVAPPIYYIARTRLVVLENTLNHAGGLVVPLDEQRALVETAREAGLAVHLDGARLFNAAVALGVEPAALARDADTVMCCLSKGLGAPVGSVLVGGTETIRRARVVRKRMGGAMRQVGVLAAAGLWALEHHVDRLADDHRRASRLARALEATPPFRIDAGRVRSNIVIAEVDPAGRADELLRALEARGVLGVSMGPGRIRFTTHLDVDDAGIARAIEALRLVAG